MLLIHETPPRRLGKACFDHRPGPPFIDIATAKEQTKNPTKRYPSMMNRRNPGFLRVLLLLMLAVGPLQAQTIFACAMTDTVMHDACCCDDHAATVEGCAVSSCDVALKTGDDPCCERTLEVTIDQDARHDTSIGKQVELRPDPDPPQIPVLSFDALIPPQPVSSRTACRLQAVAGQSGSETYLITQRLRI